MANYLVTESEKKCQLEELYQNGKITEKKMIRTLTRYAEFLDRPIKRHYFEKGIDLTFFNNIYHYPMSWVAQKTISNPLKFRK